MSGKGIFEMKKLMMLFIDPKTVIRSNCLRTNWGFLKKHKLDKFCKEQMKQFQKEFESSIEISSLTREKMHGKTFRRISEGAIWDENLEKSL